MTATDIWAVYAPWVLLAIRILTVGCCAMIVWETVGLIRIVVKIIRREDEP